MLRSQLSSCIAVLLACALAGCDGGSESGAQADLDIYGEWDGARDGDTFFLDLTNTYVVWDFNVAASMLGDVVYYDNSADFGVILWTEPSALAGQYQKFSWDILSDTTAMLQLYDEKTSLAEAIDDTYMKYDPILLTRIDEKFRGCHGGVCQAGHVRNPA